MYTIDDIQIFIATHNRAEYLMQSLDSILNQSAGVKEVTILDNESTDNTELVVKQLADKNVKYIKTSGFLGNYYKAKEIADKKYCMIFHDDDILHPDYLKIVLKLLNKHKGVSLVTTRYTHFLDDDVPKKFKKVHPDYYLFKSQKDFATNIYFLEEIAYAPAVYRTSDFKSQDVEFDRFNKYNDIPLMTKMSACGNSIIINSYDLFHVRIHQFQDSCTSENQPSVEQIINWDKFFYDIFKNSNDKMLIENYKCKSEHYLKIRWDNCVSDDLKKGFSYEQFLDYAKNNGLDDLCIDKFQMIDNKEQQKFIKSIIKKDLHTSFFNIFNLILNKKTSRKMGKEYWENYFKENNEQKYLDNLSVEVNGKKVLFYGYGIIGQLILKNYDLSKFNIVAIADKKFENTKGNIVDGYCAISPQDVLSLDFDVVVSSLCTNIPIFCLMNSHNLKQKIISAIVKK